MITDSIENGFKEDGIRSIADKIKTRLHDLDKTVESNKGRWAWELLQNAKDSISDSNERTVSVQLELNENNVVFRHNGTHFNEKDVRGIINQISSKEVIEDTNRKQTGRFGTGFLTTHILSRVVNIEGIFESNEKQFSKFKFSLDRNGKTTDVLIPKIITARNDFLQSIRENKIDQLNESAYNTSFSYDLETDEQKQIAKVGIEEFIKLIPYVLASIDTISSVEIIDNVNQRKIKFEDSKVPKDDIVIEIIKTEEGQATPINLLFAKDKDALVSIAAIIEKVEKGYNVLDIKNLPKLFCDFPLIGTETFHFPVIVNSFEFTPKTERDGIWLKKESDNEVLKNREIMEKAVELYKILLAKVASRNFYNLYNIANTSTPEVDEKSFDEKWYQQNIQNPLREFIKITPIVDTVRNGRVPMSLSETWVDFPSGKTVEEREKIWELSNIQDYFVLPLKADIHEWSGILWTKEYNCDEEFILKFIAEKANVESLQKDVGEKNVFEWLNEVYDFTVKEKKNLEVLKKHSVLPNQHGIFKKRNEIYKDEIQDEELKKIALPLGTDYYAMLLHDKIYFDEAQSSKTKETIAHTITTAINTYLNIYLKSGEEKESIKTAIRQLTKWFKDNDADAKSYFPDLYKKKEKLFVDTIKDQINLYRVADNEEQLPILANIAEAIREDNTLVERIQTLIRENKELNELKVVGEYFEKVLAEALSEYSFDVKKVIVGRDLIITLKNTNIEYAIEVKSTRAYDFVAMTPAQGKEASSNHENYALCVIYNNGTQPTIDYIKENAKLILNIGEQLKGKVIKVIEFEEKRLEIIAANDDIVLDFENDLSYKYQISNKIWRQGNDFDFFVKFITEKQRIYNL